jgi:hypothetical protein
MRLLLLLLLLPPLHAAALQVDHVSACGANLKEMQARLKSAGIPSEAGGPHSNHATEMALTSFEDGSYLELIAIQATGDPKAIAAHEWSKQMKSSSGPCAWALRSADVGAEAARLQSAGITVSKPERSGRNRPDGVRLDWETLQIGTQPRGTFFPFLIHDISPRDARAFPSAKPSTEEFSGVSKVVIAVHDLEAAVAQYRKAFSLPAPRRQADTVFGAALAWFENTPVVLAAPASPQSWLTGRLAATGDGPAAVILKAAARKADTSTVWFGSKIGWLDEKKLGWRLGFE